MDATLIIGLLAADITFLVLFLRFALPNIEEYFKRRRSYLEIKFEQQQKDPDPVSLEDLKEVFDELKIIEDAKEVAQDVINYIIVSIILDFSSLFIGFLSPILSIIEFAMVPEIVLFSSCFFLLIAIVRGVRSLLVIHKWNIMQKAPLINNVF